MQKLRLSEVLLAKYQELKSFEALAKAISEAAGGIGMDRRKLQKLVGLAGEDLDIRKLAGTADDISLRISELMALNAYLSPLGAGLAARPIFDQPSILATLAERSEVVFMFGAQPNEKRQHKEVSVWDVRCQAEILNGINGYQPNISIVMEDVMYQAPEKKDGGEIGGWEKWFTDEHDASIVCIGSPRACRASEYMLAKMFNVKHFQITKRTVTLLPFHFIWAGETDKFGSRFAVDADSIEDANEALAASIRTDPTTVMGLRVDRTVYASRRQGWKWKDYGIIAAQRRSSGQLWLVLCGLSGPTTYAAAKVLKSLADIIPPNPFGEDSKVQWAVVKSVIEEKPKTPDPPSAAEPKAEARIPGDTRRVVVQEIVGVPKLWSEGDK